MHILQLGLFYPVTATVVCCILMPILCVVSQKKLKLLGDDFVSQTRYRGSAPGSRWGTSVPQTPSLLLCPPNNPVRSTPMALSQLSRYTIVNIHQHLTNSQTRTGLWGCD